MSVFSNLFGSNEQNKMTPLEFSISKKFYKKIINSSDMMLFYSVESGWLGANRSFLKDMQFKTIESFKDHYSNIQDMFKDSKNIYIKNTKKWLDDIIENHQDGYKVSITKLLPNIFNIRVVFVEEYEVYIVRFENITAIERERAKIIELQSKHVKLLDNIENEFSNPIQNISNFMELLNNTDLNNLQKDYLKIASYTLKNLTLNMQTLLNNTKEDFDNNIMIKKSDFRFVDELTDQIYSFSKEAILRDVKVFSFIDPKIPKLLNSDSSALFQILYAITHQSLALTKRNGQINIDIKLNQIFDDGYCSISFVIKDDGDGFSKEQLLYIKENIYSQEQLSDSFYNGFLHSSSLINSLGSDLKIHSEIEKGNYFSFMLNFKIIDKSRFFTLDNKSVKLIILDKTMRDERRYLNHYFSACGLNVLETDFIDETIYKNTDLLTIIASEEDIELLEEFTHFKKELPVVSFFNFDINKSKVLEEFIDAQLSVPVLPVEIANILGKLLK